MKDPKVGGGSEGTCKITQNQPRHVPRRINMSKCINSLSYVRHISINGGINGIIIRHIYLHNRVLESFNFDRGYIVVTTIDGEVLKELKGLAHSFIDMERTYDKMPKKVLWKAIEKKCVRIAYVQTNAIHTIGAAQVRIVHKNCENNKSGPYNQL
ncbi:hypothetical protein Lal_00032847 [Lupinus albus]|nr:hypothetical protein Lal_00032847 [Lupinus albus]